MLDITVVTGIIWETALDAATATKDSCLGRLYYCFRMPSEEVKNSYINIQSNIYCCDRQSKVGVVKHAFVVLCDSFSIIRILEHVSPTL